MRGQIVKAFEKVSTVKEYLEENKKLMICKYRGIDCIMFTPVRETEKAYCFDMGEDHLEYSIAKRFCYAPKSRSKELVNDHYVDAEGNLSGDKMVLIPMWVYNGWKAF